MVQYSHTLDPAKDIVPESQLTHAADDVIEAVAEYLPAAHRKQDEEPAIAYCPVGQDAVQLLESAEEYWPNEQVVHVLAPSAAENELAAQAVQLVAKATAYFPAAHMLAANVVQ